MSIPLLGRTLFLALALSAVLGDAASAQETAVAERAIKHIARVNFASGRGKVLVRDDEAFLTMEDPRCPAQTALWIRTDGADPGQIELPCENWEFTGRGYRYADPEALAGGVAKILWKSRRLLVLLKDGAFAEVPDVRAWMEVRFTADEVSYCGRLAKFDEANRVRVRASDVFVDPCEPLPGGLVRPTATRPPRATLTPTRTFTPTFSPTPTRTPVTWFPTATATATATATLRPYPTIRITAPRHGTFVDFDAQPWALLSGQVSGATVPYVIVRGPASTQSVPVVGGAFLALVALDPSRVAQPISVEYNDGRGWAARDRVTLMRAVPVLATEPAAGVDARVSEAGIDDIGTAFIGNFNLAAMPQLAPGTWVARYNECVGWDSPVGCAGERVSGDVYVQSVRSDPPTLRADVLPETGIAARVEFPNFELVLDTEGDLECDLIFRANAVRLDFTLFPALTPEGLTATLVGTPRIDLPNLSQSNDCGRFGGIIEGKIGDKTDTVRQAFNDALADPDGTGPLQSPIAGFVPTLPLSALQASLGAVTVGVVPTELRPDDTGLTVVSGLTTALTSAPAGAPRAAASVYVEPLPVTLPTLAPQSNPYDVAVLMHPNALNRALAVLERVGVFEIQLSSIPGLFDSLTPAALAPFLPGILDLGLAPDAPLEVTFSTAHSHHRWENGDPVAITPYVLAPSPQPGFLDVHLAHGVVALRARGSTDPLLAAAVDLNVLGGFAVDPVSAELSVQIAPDGLRQFDIELLVNRLDANEELLEQIAAAQMASALSELSFGGISLPDFVDDLPVSVVSAGHLGSGAVAYFNVDTSGL